MKGSDNKTSLLDLLARWAVHDLPSGPAAPMAQLPEVCTLRDAVLLLLSFALVFSTDVTQLQGMLDSCKALSLKSLKEDVDQLVKQHDVGMRQVTNHRTNCRDASDKFSEVLLPFYEGSQKVCDTVLCPGIRLP